MVALRDSITNPLALMLQENDLATLKQFPPKQLEQLIAQRDVLLEYAKAFPVRTFGVSSILLVRYEE